MKWHSKWVEEIHQHPCLYFGRTLNNNLQCQQFPRNCHSRNIHLMRKFRGRRLLKFWSLKVLTSSLSLSGGKQQNNYPTLWKAYRDIKADQCNWSVNKQLPQNPNVTPVPPPKYKSAALFPQLLLRLPKLHSSQKQIKESKRRVFFFRIIVPPPSSKLYNCVCLWITTLSRCNFTSRSRAREL